MRVKKQIIASIIAILTMVGLGVGSTLAWFTNETKQKQLSLSVKAQDGLTLDPYTVTQPAGSFAFVPVQRYKAGDYNSSANSTTFTSDTFYKEEGDSTDYTKNVAQGTRAQAVTGTDFYHVRFNATYTGSSDETLLKVHFLRDAGGNSMEQTFYNKINIAFKWDYSEQEDDRKDTDSMPSGIKWVDKNSGNGQLTFDDIDRADEKITLAALHVEATTLKNIDMYIWLDGSADNSYSALTLMGELVFSLVAP